VLFRAETTALVNPSSSIADGALTLIVTPVIDCESARRENPPRFIAVELGTVLAGALGVLALGALVVLDGLGAVGILGLGAVAIFGRLELLGVLGAENEGLEIVATLGRSGTAL
jgi:hypothetical protein